MRKGKGFDRQPKRRDLSEKLGQDRFYLVSQFGWCKRLLNKLEAKLTQQIGGRREIIEPARKNFVDSIAQVLNRFGPLIANHRIRFDPHNRSASVQSATRP